MPNLYDVTIRVTERKLPIVLQTLSGEVSLIGVKPVAEATAIAPMRTTPITRVRDSAMTGEAMVLEMLANANRPVSTSEMKTHFVNKGRAGNSASPVLSKLQKAGKIVYLGNTMYVLKGHTVHKGATAS